MTTVHVSTIKIFLASRSQSTFRTPLAFYSYKLFFEIYSIRGSSGQYLIMSCIEALVKLASSIGVVKEFHRPIGDDGVLEANGTPTYGSRKGETTIEYVPLIFLIVDILDVGLDIIFTVQLLRMGEFLHGYQMGTALVMSLGIWFWTRRILSHAIVSGYSLSTIRIVMTFRELTMFFIQDATTLFIFTSVPESFEDNIYSTINLYTMISCISVLCGFQLYLAFESGWKGCWGHTIYYFLVTGLGGLVVTKQFYTYILSFFIWSFIVVSNIYALKGQDWEEELLTKMGVVNAFFFCYSKDSEDK